MPTGCATAWPSAPTKVASVSTTSPSSAGSTNRWRGSTESVAVVDVELKIKRYNPEQDTKPHWETYEVRVEDTDRVVDALHEVKWHHDGTLSFRRSCVHGVCGSDAMVINGSNALACVLLVKDVGTKISVEPIRGLRVLKDLVVDMARCFDQYKSVLPYPINSKDPGYEQHKQSPEDRERVDDTTQC